MYCCSNIRELLSNSKIHIESNLEVVKTVTNLVKSSNYNVNPDVYTHYICTCMRLYIYICVYVCVYMGMHVCI